MAPAAPSYTGVSSLRFASEYRVSILLTLLVVAGGIVTDYWLTPSARLTLKHDLGFDRTALLAGRWWVMGLSPFVQADPGMGIPFWTTAAVLAAAGGFIERTVGHVAVAVVFFGAHILSSFLTLGILALAAHAGSREASTLLTAKDTGVSAAVVGLLGASFALVRDRRVLWLWAGIAAWMLLGTVRFRADTEIAHGTAVIVGAAIAWLVPAFRRRRVG